MKKIAVSCIFLMALSCGMGTVDYYAESTARPTLAIRNEPDINGKKTGIVPFGGKVHVLKESAAEKTVGDRKGKWVYIDYEGLKGWAFNGYLTKLDTMSNVEVTLSDKEIAIHKNITVSMTRPHGEYLVIISPDNVQYYLACPLPEYCDKKEFSPDTFVNAESVAIDTGTLKLKPFVYKAEAEKVFRKNGSYRIIVASNWNSEFAEFSEAKLSVNVPGNE